jgi:hypothetical protein
MVHDILDKYLPIEEHRRTHNPQTIKAIGELLGKDAETEAWLHFLMDYHLIFFPKKFLRGDSVKREGLTAQK